MAEIFGTAAAALSVAALFNNCVDCFEYIQLGRHFGRDYQMCQLKLDIARTRLGRWGQAVNINDNPRFDTETSDDKLVQLSRSILEEIVLLFQSVYKTSKRYEMVAEQQDLSLFEDKDMKPIFRGLHNRLQELARRRQKNTSLAKKTAWALYDGKNFERMVDQVTSFVDELEKLFPVEGICRSLAEIDIEEVRDEPTLTVLKEAADGTDKALLDVTVQKMETIAGRNHVKDIKTQDSADVQIGNQYSEEIVGRGFAIAERTTNSAESVEARGTSMVQIGNRFGVRLASTTAPESGSKSTVQIGNQFGVRLASTTTAPESGSK